MRIGITMGDPRGIAPEVTRAALTALRGAAHWVAYAPTDLYGSGLPPIEYVAPDPRDQIRDAIELSATDLRLGRIDAVVTGPVSKSCFRGDFPGHTELYAARLGVGDGFVMMLTGPRLRVVPVTTHVALADVQRLITVERLLRAGRIVHRELTRVLGIARPRIAYAGLNPHASDGGLFGDEEARIIAPAVAALRAEEIEATGPWSPDTVFYQAAHGHHDVVISPYHDQCLVPFKLLHFSDGVNVTLGLPRPRTSPDHGPAYDIAGSGSADATSMIRALELAMHMVAVGAPRGLCAGGLDG